ELTPSRGGAVHRAHGDPCPAALRTPTVHTPIVPAKPPGPLQARDSQPPQAPPEHPGHQRHR
ncbi:hypothetical protein ACFU50_36950, partial [Streptomyces celluloflavus]